MKFDDLGLSAGLLRAIGEQGYTTPTPIQHLAIPPILQGKDLMAAAQTGTGKTAAFLLPLLQRMESSPPGKKPGPPQALVLTPTRELAAQVTRNAEALGHHLPLRTAVVFGGVKIAPQARQLRQGVDLLVATPGRLLDHARQGNLDLSRVKTLVLDEADRMLDMGFIHDIRRLLALLPPTRERQNLLFSATFSNEIRNLARGLMNHPEMVEAGTPNTATPRVSQVVHPVDRRRKRELLSHMIGSRQWQQVLVFTRTRHGANRLARQLEQDGLSTAAIHGNKSQGARTRALAGFKAGRIRVLVATDIAARGLDIDDLPRVVNFELPDTAEDYVHRIGRTGRAGREGEAISLVCTEERKQLADIERLLRQRIPHEALEGYEPSTSLRPRPAGEEKRRSRKAGTRSKAPRKGRPAARRTTTGVARF